MFVSTFSLAAWMRRGAPVLAGVLLCLGTAPAWAQSVDAEGYAIVSEAQGQLNVEGVQAMQAQDWDKAIRLFRSAIDLSELNVSYLNLGRALTRAGRCEEAVVAYDKVLKAPKVREPSPEFVKQKLAEYRIELNSLCPGKMKIICDPPEMRVSIDKGEQMPCPKDPLVVKSGLHQVDGVAHGSRIGVEVSVVAMETTEVRLMLEREEGEVVVYCRDAGVDVGLGTNPPQSCDGSVRWSVPEGEHPLVATGAGSRSEFNLQVRGKERLEVHLALTPAGIVQVSGDALRPEATESAALMIAGWTTLGVGVAALATFAIVDLTALGSLVDDMEKAGAAGDVAAFERAESDFKSLRTVNYILLGVGSAAVVTGATLVLIDLLGGDAEASGHALVPWWGGEGAGLGWRVAF